MPETCMSAIRVLKRDCSEKISMIWLFLESPGSQFTTPCALARSTYIGVYGSEGMAGKGGMAGGRESSSEHSSQHSSGFSVVNAAEGRKFGEAM